MHILAIRAVEMHSRYTPMLGTTSAHFAGAHTGQVNSDTGGRDLGSALGGVT